MNIPTNKAEYDGYDSLADMIKGHIGNWREALTEQMAQSILDDKTCGREHEGADCVATSYLQHELKALDAIEKAVAFDLGL